LISFLNKCDSSKAILTTYPMGYELPNKVPTDLKPPILVAEEFGSDGMLRLKGKQLTLCFDKPLRSLFWVSGFAFSKAEVIQEVPYDPHLPFLFFGEEALMNLRLWTHGWDFYAPGENIIFHLWTRDYRHNFREIKVENRIELEKKSIERVMHFLGMKSVEGPLEEEEKYGLGKERSTLDYSTFSGVNFGQKTIEEKARWGGQQQNLFLDNLLNLVMGLSIKSNK